MKALGFEKIGRFHKVSPSGVAYGWAFVSTIKGLPYFDTGDGEHSDHIPADSIEPVAALFMDTSRVGLDMHDGAPVADVLHTMPMTDEIMIGNDIASEKQGLMIGWRCPDPALLDKIAKGERTGFSIGGLVQAWDIVDNDGNVIETVRVSDKSARTFGAGLAIGKRDLEPGAAGAAIAKMKRRIFRAWKLKEISLVDYPMQEPALVGVVRKKAIRKLHSIARVVEKGAMFTTIVDGHQHTLSTLDVGTDGLGSTSWETSEGADYGHSHGFMHDTATGKLTLTMNEGHTHEIGARAVDNTVPRGNAEVIVAMRSAVSDAENLTPGSTTPSVKSTQEPAPMTQPTIPDPRDATIALLQKRMSVLASLPEDQRAYYAKLSIADQPGFLDESSTARVVAVKAAADTNPVRYTGKHGTRKGRVYRESEAELADMAKEADESFDSSITSKAKAETEISKRQAAETFKLFAGPDAIKLRVMKAIRAEFRTEKGELDDESYKQALEMLAGADAALRDGFESTGGDGVDPNNADDPTAAGDGVQMRATNKNTALEKLDKLVEKHAAENGLHPSVAKRQLLKTNKMAKQLYNESANFVTKQRRAQGIRN